MLHQYICFVESIRGFVHAAGFAAAWRCLQFVVTRFQLLIPNMFHVKIKFFKIIFLHFRRGSMLK